MITFDMCDCGGPVPHGLFKKGNQILPVVSKEGAKRALEVFRRKNEVGEEEKISLTAQVEASSLLEQEPAMAELFDMMKSMPVLMIRIRGVEL